MNEWLVAALVLLVAMLPLLAVCTFSSAVDGLVALQVAGTNAAFILLLLSEGIQRQAFADLAIVLALLSFGGSLAFSYFLERVR
jgi:multisubunit Na+/H+ antiporter MnhF subunit